MNHGFKYVLLCEWRCMSQFLSYCHSSFVIARMEMVINAVNAFE